MYSFRISKVAPFWARNNENKPNSTIFNQWLNDNMTVATNLAIHFINFTTFTLNGAYNDIKYIEITNTQDNNDVRYYYVDAIEMDTGNNTYKYRGVIDVYTTYTLKFINDNLDKDFTFLRHHEYDKRCLQIVDNYLEELPKVYSSYYFKKVLFNHNSNNDVWYGESIGVTNNNDLTNANKYYVFKDGVNGGYSFYPVLSNTLEVEVHYKGREQGELINEYYYWNGRAANDEYVNIQDDLNNAIVEGYKNNRIIEYCYHEVTNNGLSFGAWKKIKNVPYGTLPIDIRTNSNQWNQAGAGIKQASFDVYLLGNNVYHYRSGNCLVWDHSTQWERCKEFRQLKVNIYNATVNWHNKTVKNSMTGLEELRKKEGYINKFLGIYYLPHFLNFDSQRLNFQDDYVYLNINPQKDDIGLFKIYEYQLSNITDKLNNTSYSTEYLLRYLNIKYYGNLINAEYRTNDQHCIYIGGKLFFTDTANIISKSNDYINLTNSIINYPYQLPVGVDTYEQYVKANRNVTDTSFNIARKQQELAFAKSIVGGITGITGAAGKAITGDFAGAAKATIDTGIGLGFDIAGQMQGLANQEAQIRAQYQQANNTMGNNMQFSNIETAALMAYYNDDTNEQYEGVEVSELDKNILALINNYIYLNGYLLPNVSTFKSKINNNRLFNYIQLDATLLNNQLNIKYDNNKYNNAIYQMIKEQLIQGIRIWNNINEDIPEYDDNEEWPNQPDDTRPEIPPEQPPKPPITVPDEYILSSDWKYTNRNSVNSWEPLLYIGKFVDNRFIIRGYDNKNNDFVCNDTKFSAVLKEGNYFTNIFDRLDFTLDCSNLKVSDLCYANNDTSNGFAIIRVYEKPNISSNGNLIIRLKNVSEEIKEYIKGNNKSSFVHIEDDVYNDNKFKVISIYVNGEKIYGK